MLVLRRRNSESIILNGVIKITVLGIEGGTVKIGIEAPPDVIVVRDELLDDNHTMSQHTPQTRRLPPEHETSALP